jgi:hypothetical protein
MDAFIFSRAITTVRIDSGIGREIAIPCSASFFHVELRSFTNCPTCWHNDAVAIKGIRLLDEREWVTRIGTGCVSVAAVSYRRGLRRLPRHENANVNEKRNEEEYEVTRTF